MSEAIAAEIKDLLQTSKPVVLTSRCYESLVLEDAYAFVGSEKHLRELGVIPAPGLNGPKARVKLILALSYTRDLNRVRDMFRTPIKYG